MGRVLEHAALRRSLPEVAPGERDKRAADLAMEPGREAVEEAIAQRRPSGHELPLLLHGVVAFGRDAGD